MVVISTLLKISPARFAALAEYVGAAFHAYQREHTAHQTTLYLFLGGPPCEYTTRWLGASHKPSEMLTKNDSTHRYLPVMINRLMLSLKKAADTSEVARSPGGFFLPSKQPHDLEFVQISDEDTLSFTGEDVSLATVSSTISESVTRGCTDGGSHSLSLLEINHPCKNSSLGELQSGIYSCSQETLSPSSHSTGSLSLIRKAKPNSSY